MVSFGKFFKILTALMAGVFSAGLVAALAIYLYFSPSLPDVTTLRDVKYQVPLKIYTSDDKLIAEYGDKQRIPLRFKQIPPQLIHAFLAAEDARFYEHSGVSIRGLLRATYELIRTGHKTQGGSTITMQVARNFFLSDRKTYSRKIREILLALKIEKTLTKDQILDLYLNKIYLGNRAYGIGAASQVYYGKDAKDLTLAQMAMIAGLPKAPSTINPLANPKLALARRAYVLKRMRDLHYITEKQYQNAMQAPITASLHQADIQIHAPYVAEMVRAQMVSRYGDNAYSAGFNVYTTITSKDQLAANHALRNDLLAYTERHGYRGPEAKISLDTAAIRSALVQTRQNQKPEENSSSNGLEVSSWNTILAKYPTIGGLISGLVLSVHRHSARVYVKTKGIVDLNWKDMNWARPFISQNRQGPRPTDAAAILKTGDIIRLRKTTTGWRLSQIPKVQGALVALDPDTGGIVALVGGFDFYRSKFNRVTQALRQPGSSFKPFIYSAALHKGYTPASLINDAPIVVKDSALGGSWRPENYERRFNGPTRLRIGLVESMNLVSIRLLQSIGIDYALSYVSRFGFDSNSLPHNLTLALGSGDVTPLQMAQAYAVFANGGFRTTPYYIERITNGSGQTVFQADHPVACESNCRNISSSMSQSPNEVTQSLAKRVITADNAYQMTSMLKDVIRMGTGRAALSLHRTDLAGKTGTTNDQVDAWFCGYDSRRVAVAWVGFDDNKPLGHYETGAHAALPMWINFMGAALKGVPESTMPQPPGMVTVRINPKTGKLARPGDPTAVFETFRKKRLPGTDKTPNQDHTNLTEQLF